MIFLRKSHSLVVFNLHMQYMYLYVQCFTHIDTTAVKMVSVSVGCCNPNQSKTVNYMLPTNELYT